MNVVHIVDTARSPPPTAWVETLQKRHGPPPGSAGRWPAAPFPPEETCMATTRKTPPRRKASPKVRKGSTPTKAVADPDRPRVVKTATRKAAASDPRAARVAARQRRLQDQEKAKDARAAKKATKKTATQAGARRPGSRSSLLPSWPRGRPWPSPGPAGAAAVQRRVPPVDHWRLPCGLRSSPRAGDQGRRPPWSGCCLYALSAMPYGGGGSSWWWPCRSPREGKGLPASGRHYRGAAHAASAVSPPTLLAAVSAPCPRCARHSFRHHV